MIETRWKYPIVNGNEPSQAAVETATSDASRVPPRARKRLNEDKDVQGKTGPAEMVGQAPKRVALKKA